MCENCYHRLGRTKKAWLCSHTRKVHYSKGLCKYCYLANYYKNRAVKRARSGGTTVDQPAGAPLSADSETPLAAPGSREEALEKADTSIVRISAAAHTMPCAPTEEK